MSLRSCAPKLATAGAVWALPRYFKAGQKGLEGAQRANLSLVAESVQLPCSNTPPETKQAYHLHQNVMTPESILQKILSARAHESLRQQFSRVFLVLTAGNIGCGIIYIHYRNCK